MIELDIPLIETDRLLLTIAPVEAAERMAVFYAENIAHFAPWDPPMAAEISTEPYWQNQLAQALTEFREGRALRLTLFDRQNTAGEIPAGEIPVGEIIGTCHFSQIFRGPFQACYLGYKIAARHEGSGLMYEALEAAIRYAFDDLRLHRIMANYMPHNVRSGHLLNRLGFRVEGTARDYLFINGAWRDHVLTSRLNPAFTEFRWY